MLLFTGLKCSMPRPTTELVPPAVVPPHTANAEPVVACAVVVVADDVGATELRFGLLWYFDADCWLRIGN